MLPEFQGFGKIPRLNREIVITEKIDGTNAQILITEEGEVFAGSRTRWLTPESDNYGFARWVQEHTEELKGLGVGRHFGEWWGSGINRRYGMFTGEKWFSLFNVAKWHSVWPDNPPQLPDEPSRLLRPSCCDVVPVLYRGPFSQVAVYRALLQLTTTGSVVAPGFMNPEGVVVFHKAAGALFKVTLENDEQAKGQRNVS